MNFKRNAVIFTVLICIFCTVSCAAAGDVNDTVMNACENPAGDELIASSPDDLISGGEDDVIAASQDDLLSAGNAGTFTELQAMIVSASNGTTITLDKDYNYDGFNDGRGILIAKDITIDGNGHTLNGLSNSRILFVLSNLEDNKVTLNNIVFKNGFTKYYGGAILNFANLTVNNCVFEKNYADTTAGAICSVGSLICKNSNFNKNTANGSGGAIFSLNFADSKFYFNASNIISNIVDENSIIYALMMDTSIKPGTDYISNCKFTNNVALGRGGGAVYAYTHINIASSTFTSNKAKDVGGAVYAAKNLVVKNSKFTKNTAKLYGGAVYFKFHELSGHYDAKGNWVSDINFYSNTIEKCTFTENAVNDRGGAIYIFKYSKMPKKTASKAVKCTFKDNLADLGNEIYGGALKSCTLKNTLTLKTVKVKKSAKKLVLSATLKKGSKAIKNKKVTFKFNGKTYKAKTNSKGIAKVTIKSSVLKKLKVGKQIQYQASYSKYHEKKIAKVSK